MTTIAILYPGDMGHGIGAARTAAGDRAVSCLKDRSAETVMRAKRSGFDALDDLEAVCTQADIILSILPPAAALGLAESVAGAMKRANAFPPYADCNAIAPETTRRIADIIKSAGAPFIDGGIIGPHPGRGRTRLYVSGEDTAPIEAINGNGVFVYPIGQEIGRASALKMAYASFTKTRAALDAAVLLAARRLGVYDELTNELKTSQTRAWEVMQGSVPFLAADAERWSGEMDEIARTYAATGLTPDFHRGASEIFRILAASPLGRETRETRPQQRTLEEALSAFEEALPSLFTGQEPRA